MSWRLLYRWYDDDGNMSFHQWTIILATVWRSSNTFIRTGCFFFNLPLIMLGATIKVSQFIKLLKSIHNKNICLNKQRCILIQHRKVKTVNDLYDRIILFSFNIVLFAFSELPSRSSYSLQLWKGKYIKIKTLQHEAFVKIVNCVNLSALKKHTFLFI
jgi:hypothetical protein